MIKTAAYYRAEKRGFSDGDPVKDWLEAESEIAALFEQLDDAESSLQERAVYQRMRAEFKKILAGAQDTIKTDTISQAFGRSGRELKELGKFVPATVDRAGRRLKQEVAGAVEKLGPRWHTFSEKSHGFFEIWKDKGSQYVNETHTALNSRLGRYRDRNGKKKSGNGSRS
jgi:hypothetical protein